MSNHCSLVICSTCGAIYCTRCGRADSLPDKENVIYNQGNFKVHVKNEVCKHCEQETLYIYSG